MSTTIGITAKVIDPKMTRTDVERLMADQLVRTFQKHKPVGLPVLSETEDEKGVKTYVLSYEADEHIPTGVGSVDVAEAIVHLMAGEPDEALLVLQNAMGFGNKESIA